MPFCHSKQNCKNTYCFPFNIVKLFVPQTLSKVASCVQFDATLLFSLFILSSLGGSGYLFKFLLIIIQGQCKRYIHASFDPKLSLPPPFALSSVHYCITLRSWCAKRYKQSPLNQRKNSYRHGNQNTIHWLQWVKKGALRWWITACKSFPWWWEDQAAGGRLWELNLIGCVENALLAQQITLQFHHSSTKELTIDLWKTKCESYILV